MPSLLLDVLLFVGQMMAFGPLIALAVYLLLFHGHEEQREAVIGFSGLELNSV